MLKELSIRNAKRQSKDYLLYFITLACTVSFMYAFNSLIFSDIVKAFPSIGVLPYMIIVASLLIVLIMGWIVGYMTKYILKKRSRELSIYMISGIPNRSICRLIFYENALIGIFAFVIGLPVGILFSQLLEAVLSSMFGAGYLFAEDSIFCEPFSQMDTYGNGLDFCIIVPEQAVSQMTTLYSLLSVITETPLDSRDLQNIVQMCDGLSMLKRNIGKTASDGSGVTALIDNVDYLSGKWVDKESLTQLYAMAICLFYLSLVFEITGAAILATQILSDREKKRRQDCILQQLGMNRRDIEKLNNRQLSMMFLLPLLPALIISSCFVYVSAGKMQLSAFHLPVFSNNLWIIGSLSIAFVFFILLYGVYYIAARISYRRQ